MALTRAAAFHVARVVNHAVVMVIWLLIHPSQPKSYSFHRIARLNSQSGRTIVTFQLLTMASNKRAGSSLEQPTAKGPRCVKLTDDHFESSDSDSSKSGDESESDSGSDWNSDVEVPPEHENAGARDQDLNVGQAIQAAYITVTHRGGTETQREGAGVVQRPNTAGGACAEQQLARARRHACGLKGGVGGCVQKWSGDLVVGLSVSLSTRLTAAAV